MLLIALFLFIPLFSYSRDESCDNVNSFLQQLLQEYQKKPLIQKYPVTEKYAKANKWADTMHKKLETVVSYDGIFNQLTGFDGFATSRIDWIEFADGTSKHGYQLRMSKKSFELGEITSTEVHEAVHMHVNYSKYKPTESKLFGMNLENPAQVKISENTGTLYSYATGFRDDEVKAHLKTVFMELSNGGNRKTLQAFNKKPDGLYSFFKNSDVVNVEKVIPDVKAANARIKLIQRMSADLTAFHKKELDFLNNLQNAKLKTNQYSHTFAMDDASLKFSKDDGIVSFNYKVEGKEISRSDVRVEVTEDEKQLFHEEVTLENYKGNQAYSMNAAERIKEDLYWKERYIAVYNNIDFANKATKDAMFSRYDEVVTKNKEAVNTILTRHGKNTADRLAFNQYVENQCAQALEILDKVIASKQITKEQYLLLRDYIGKASMRANENWLK